MYGGGVNVLNKHNKNEYHLPFEIELLFDNKKLELFQYLVILYFCLKDRQQRKLSLEQLLYYYTVIFFEKDFTKIPLIFKYNKDKSKINEILIVLSNLHYIEVGGNMTTSIKNLKFSISKQGIEFIEGIESPILENYFEATREVIQKRPYEKDSIYFNKLLYKGDDINESE